MNVKRFEEKLAAPRELTEAEREQAMRNPSQRDQLLLAETQDALLATLPQPRVPTRAIGRILTATTLAPARNFALRTQARRWAAAVALALTVALSSTGYATASSLPGDTLYPLKRDAEQVRMALTFNAGNRSSYQLHLGAVRRAEAQQVLARGRQGVEVDFVGTLQRDADGGWSVSGLPVTLESGTVVTPGMQVQVHGATEGQRIRVRLLRHDDAPGEGAIRSGTPATERKQEGSHTPETKMNQEGSHTPIAEGGQGGNQHRIGQQTADPSATIQPTATATSGAATQSAPTSTGNNPDNKPTQQAQPSQQSVSTAGPGEPQQGQTIVPQPGPKGGRN